MILGRSTPQWISLITAAGGLVQLLIVTLLQEVDPVIVATVIGAIITFLGTFLAFLASTSTTPSGDPQLKAGTPIRVTDDNGAIIGHMPVPTPEPTPAMEPPPPTATGWTGGTGAGAG